VEEGLDHPLDGEAVLGGVGHVLRDVPLGDPPRPPGSEALLQGFCHDGRKGKLIQDFAQALRGLGECELALPGGIFQPCALGQSYRQSGNVPLRY